MKHKQELLTASPQEVRAGAVPVAKFCTRLEAVATAWLPAC
jgi:hypothetical protein